MEKSLPISPILPNIAFLCFMWKRNDSTLKEVMQKMIDHYRLRSNLDRIAVEKFWKEEMGKLINDYTEKIYFSRKGDLMIKVSSAALKNELFMNRENIKTRINAYLGGEQIKAIRIV